MPKCRECRFYKRIDDKKGNCFGHEVPGDMDSSKCPTKSFKPKESGNI